LGCVRYFKENLPDGTLGAAQLIYGAVMWGVVMIPAAIIGGYLYEIYNLNAYWAMVVLVIIGLIIMLLAKNKNTHIIRI
jgi:MFS family permease